MVNKTMDEKQGRRRRRQQETVEENLEALETAADDIDEEDDDDVEDSAAQRGLTPKKGRPTPGRRTRAEQEEAESKGITASLGGVRGYLVDTRDELRKVVWPTQEETRRLFIVVLITVIVAGLVLGAISLLFTEVVRIGVGTPALLLGILGVVIVATGVYFYLSNRRTGSRF